MKQSRQNNIVIDGIHEPVHEKWPESEENIHEMTVNKLQIDGR